MTHPFVTLARARQLATGSTYDFKAPSLSPRCSTEAEFKAVVSSYYVFFNESLANDIAFFTRRRQLQAIEDCRRLVYNLRTAGEHGDNADAVARARSWRAKHGSPQDAADALGASLAQALDVLANAATRCARSRPDAEEWREAVSIDVGSVLTAVAADLGLWFTPRRHSWLVRQIEGRLRFAKTTRGERRALVAEYCVQEITSDREVLPVPYSDVLDMLGLLRDRRASAAILVAHSVAAVSPQLDGQDFLARVEETWRAAGAD